MMLRILGQHGTANVHDSVYVYPPVPALKDRLVTYSLYFKTTLIITRQTLVPKCKCV